MPSRAAAPKSPPGAWTVCWPDGTPVTAGELELGKRYEIRIDAFGAILVRRPTRRKRKKGTKR
jgi:hypothetical protein